jgi:hypothetical protein
MRLLGGQAWVPLITPSVATAMQAVTVVLLLAAAAGIRPYHLFAALACIAMTISEGMLRGEGVIPHAPLALLLTTYVLACVPADDALTLTPKRARGATGPAVYQAALVAAGLIFSFTYALSAARRLSTGGLEIYFDDSILAMIATAAAEWGHWSALGIQACESTFMAWSLRLSFPVVTLIELLSPLCIFSRRFRWIWIAVIVPFHIGVGILMAIWFTCNLLLIPLLVAGFDPFRSPGSGTGEDRQPRDALCGRA